MIYHLSGRESEGGGRRSGSAPDSYRVLAKTGRSGLREALETIVSARSVGVWRVARILLNTIVNYPREGSSRRSASGPGRAPVVKKKTVPADVWFLV